MDVFLILVGIRGMTEERYYDVYIYPLLKESEMQVAGAVAAIGVAFIVTGWILLYAAFMVWMGGDW